MGKSVLPKTIFVIREEDGGETIYLAEEAVDKFAEVGEKRRVGVYGLVREINVTAAVKSEDA